MKTVIVTHDYHASAKHVWAMATDLDDLKRVMEGVVRFDGLPSGRVHTGQNLTVKVSLFGRLPAQPYHMEVIECDNAAMVLQSSEKGVGVKSWRHRLTVEETPEGCRLRDVIEIDAGWLTGLFAAWARYLYRKRHAPRLRLLDERGQLVSQTE